MAERVTIVKAAELLGVKRQELQQLIRQGRLHAFEGKVAMEELRRRYPSLSFEGPSEYERVTLIRRDAFSRHVARVIVPEKSELEERLNKRTAELGLQRARAAKYHALLDRLMRRLVEMENVGSEAERKVATDLNRWLVSHMAKE